MHEQDTYRGRVCECPVVNGVQYDGDGYTHCKGTPSSLHIARETLETACKVCYGVLMSVPMSSQLSGQAGAR